MANHDVATYPLNLTGLQDLEFDILCYTANHTVRCEDCR